MNEMFYGKIQLEQKRMFYSIRKQYNCEIRVLYININNQNIL